MSRQQHAAQVGAPDPEQRTSPILDPLDANGEPTLDAEIETGVCYFNGSRFPIGEYVRSGHDLLHCSERGIWLKVSED